MGTNEDTVKSYEASAAEYAAEAASMPEWVAGEIEAFVDALGGIGRILEIGSAGGRGALELERRGLSVRCTDVAQGFVDLLRADGFGADRLDPLTDDLADPQHPDTPYDGVWSCACLFHVAREELVTVLGRLAKSTRSGGRIHASFEGGDGEDRSTNGTPMLHRHAVAGARPAFTILCCWMGRRRGRFTRRQAVVGGAGASTMRPTELSSTTEAAADRPARQRFS